jgi:hypothetical protein
VTAPSIPLLCGASTVTQEKVVRAVILVMSRPSELELQLVAVGPVRRLAGSKFDDFSRNFFLANKPLCGL